MFETTKVVTLTVVNHFFQLFIEMCKKCICLLCVFIEFFIYY